MNWKPMNSSLVFSVLVLGFAVLWGCASKPNAPATAPELRVAVQANVSFSLRSHPEVGMFLDAATDALNEAVKQNVLVPDVVETFVLQSRAKEWRNFQGDLAWQTAFGYYRQAYAKANDAERKRFLQAESDGIRLGLANAH